MTERKKSNLSKRRRKKFPHENSSVLYTAASAATERKAAEKANSSSQSPAFPFSVIIAASEVRTFTRGMIFPAVSGFSQPAKSVSANADLYLKNVDLTLSITGVTATFEADGLSFEKTAANKYKFNDGTGSVSFESVSGKVRLEEK